MYAFEGPCTPDKDIQAVMEQYRTVLLEKRTIQLHIMYYIDFKQVVAWLDQCLTDKVRALRLDFINHEYSSTYEQAIYEIATSRKKLEIFIYVQEFFRSAFIKFTNTPTHVVITTQYYLDSADEFHQQTSRDVVAALSNNDSENTAQIYRSIKAEKDSPASYSRIIGLHLTSEICQVSDRFMEFLSKLPYLKILQYHWEPDENMSKFVRFIQANATALQEISVRGNLSEPMLVSVNDLITHCKTLKTLAIQKEVRPTRCDDHSFELNALATNKSIRELTIDFYRRRIQHFIEPLRRNQTITSLTIKSIVVLDVPDIREFMKMIGTKTCLRRLVLDLHYHGSDKELEITNLLLLALENKNIVELDLSTMAINNNEQIMQKLFANPHLTSVKIKEGIIPQLLQHHLDKNKLHREAMQIGLIVISYNIARTMDQVAENEYLPKDIWCIIMSFVEYPGIDQPFGDIFRELIVNSRIRRVIKDASV